jgi:membrane-bound acyltransferase YfiQ involved in biofilm formation
MSQLTVRNKAYVNILSLIIKYSYLTHYLNKFYFKIYISKMYKSVFFDNYTGRKISVILYFHWLGNCAHINYHDAIKSK